MDETIAVETARLFAEVEDMTKEGCIAICLALQGNPEWHRKLQTWMRSLPEPPTENQVLVTAAEISGMITPREAEEARKQPFVQITEPDVLPQTEDK